MRNINLKSSVIVLSSLSYGFTGPVDPRAGKTFILFSAAGMKTPPSGLGNMCINLQIAAGYLPRFFLAYNIASPSAEHRAEGEAPGKSAESKVARAEPYDALFYPVLPTRRGGAVLRRISAVYQKINEPLVI
jgi:hypothetical protein